MLFALDGAVVGGMAVADKVKGEAAAVVAELRHRMGVRVMMVTGDCKDVAQAVAASVGIPADCVISEALPEHKAAVVRKLQVSEGIDGAVVCCSEWLHAS